jgi:serine/threonine protein kinase
MVSDARAVLDPARALPRRFGRYALFDSIGKGGMAEIYLARVRTDFGGSRLCVVKQIAPEFALVPRFAEMLTFEAKLAARLNHANIVQVFDLGREGDRLFVAMDYVEGYDLNALLGACSKKNLALPVEFALRIVSEILAGLDYAHRATDDAGRTLGIVHRDVSPSNVLVSLEGEVKLCDFGIAHASDVVLAADDARAGEAIRGKANYMSPEQARGDVVDARSDVFSTGVLLWELLSGRRRFPKEDDRQRALARARGGEVEPLAVRAEGPSDLQRIVGKAVKFAPGDRYPSASAMLRDIEECIVREHFVASQIRFADWLSTHFGTDLVEQRRARERAFVALEQALPPSIPAPPPEPVKSDVPRPSANVVTKTGGAMDRESTAMAVRTVAIPKPPRMPSMADIPGVDPLTMQVGRDPRDKRDRALFVVASVALLVATAFLLYEIFGHR